MTETFPAGSEIEVREVLHGRMWASWREVVVSDADDVLATLQSDGTPLHFHEHPVPHPWGHLSAWTGTSVLKLRRPGEWWSVWRFFDGSRPLRWYVNFETPYVRREGAIEVNDLQLDIVVPPDGPWWWKDVEDLAPSLASGRITQSELLSVLAAATEVAVLLERDERWWSRWDSWAPGPRQ